jgi:hypothetical protein
VAPLELPVYARVVDLLAFRPSVLLFKIEGNANDARKITKRCNVNIESAEHGIDPERVVISTDHEFVAAKLTIDSTPTTLSLHITVKGPLGVDRSLVKGAVTGTSSGRQLFRVPYVIHCRG